MRMTHTTKEILDHYQIRKSKKQKEAFFNWLKPILTEAGYKVTLEVGTFGARNIVIGDPKTAKIFFSAHYDTCAVMPVPNFITPKNPLIYFAYQIFISFVIIGLAIAAMIGAAMINEALMMPVYLGVAGLLLGLLLFGPANKHTANDNTSGTTAVIDLALQMPLELREKACFVLFDLEEMGLFGSKAFSERHPLALRGKPLVNLDCVSDGETMLFCFRKESKRYMDQLRSAFPADERCTPEFVHKHYINPSDHINFDHGIGVASMRKTKGGILYMDKIHTKKDTVYRQENIEYLVDGCIRLTESL